MVEGDPRAVLARLIQQRGEDCASLSRLIGRNPAYVQQFIRRGTPRRLAEADRARLAAYFGVPETWLGAAEAPAPAVAPLWTVPMLDIAASAGPGAVAEDRLSAAGMGFSEAWLRRLRPDRGDREGLSVIRVRGISMLPTLADGDEILVDRHDAHDRLRDGIYVLRVDDVLLVKRLVREGDGFAVRSDNPDAGPVDLAGGAVVIGRVLWAGRTL
ncbi:S24 family peptidase [Sphingomonas abietis]|uniref:Peptidase S24 n=1 Tax=Sphingomonas abietis TaxID=3012344 RepID=A0ABY7NL02_9SPHN|nr:S24 family peptidase [Sphingomonas abietis]WBO22174.1 peptidase S24 [Sphingomonas abietis]